MNQLKEQQFIRTASPQFRSFFGKKEAVTESRPTRQNAPQGPSTLAELAEALRNPLPPAPPKPKCYNALEAFANWKPLTMQMVSELIAKERAARDAIMADYTARTGEAVDYCENCELGVREVEIEEACGTRTETEPCQECDGLGVIKL